MVALDGNGTGRNVLLRNLSAAIDADAQTALLQSIDCVLHAHADYVGHLVQRHCVGIDEVELLF